MKKTSCMLLVALLMLLCGTALAANDEVHRCYSFSYAYDDEYHWEVCDHCGTVKGEKWEHTNPCNNVGTCHCGATGLTKEIDHYWGKREYNENDCWLVCEDCGFEDEHRPHYFLCGDELPAKCQWCKQPCEITHLWGDRLDYTPGNCIEGDISVMKCSICGIVETKVGESTGECWYEWYYDDVDHWLACTGCGKIDGEKYNHFAYCKDVDTCDTCGATGLSCEVFHRWGAMVHDETNHWNVCEYCGIESGRSEHYTVCTNTPPDTCLCGVKVLNGPVFHWWGRMAYDDQAHWYVCEECGAEDEHSEHYSGCTDENPGICLYCGQPCEIDHMMETIKYNPGNCVEGATIEQKCQNCGVEEETIVEESTGECWYEFVNQGDTHAYMCTGCGTTQWTDKHVVPCTGGTTCVDCGAEGVTGGFSHEAADGWHYDNEKCWLNCANCDAHAFENPHWNFCNAMDACINCGATNVTLAAAHNTSEISAMDYGLVSCWYICDTCGEACYHMPHLFEEGGACSVCGFAGIATVPVENASVEGENLSADVTLLVEQPQEDVSALLPEDIRAFVQQVYLVKLLEKGETIEPNGSIRITIQLEEGADLTGKKLMLLQADGTLAEIAYEVVECKLTFVTEAVGTFVLVDATAE